MGTKNYTLESFAREFPGDVKRHAQALMIGFHEGLDAEAGTEFARLGEAVRDTGELASKMGSSRNGRQTVPAAPNSNKGKIRVGAKTARINTAAHGAVIDAGRKRNHYKNFSKMGGSDKAPRGISKPTKEHVLNHAPRIAGEVIQKVDAAFGRR